MCLGRKQGKSLNMSPAHEHVKSEALVTTGDDTLGYVSSQPGFAVGTSAGGPSSVAQLEVQWWAGEGHPGDNARSFSCRVTLSR